MARKHFLYLSTKDICVLHQITPRTARNRLRKIRNYFGKLPDQYVTIMDYCLYMEVDEAAVIRALQGENK